jgi:hypothetical protein
LPSLHVRWFPRSCPLNHFESLDVYRIGEGQDSACSLRRAVSQPRSEYGLRAIGQAYAWISAILSLSRSFPAPEYFVCFSLIIPCDDRALFGRVPAVLTSRLGDSVLSGVPPGVVEPVSGGGDHCRAGNCC